MKKKVCFITNGHNDKYLANTLRYAEDCIGKYIVFPRMDMEKDIIWGIPIAQEDRVFECIDESDIIVFSREAEAEYKDWKKYIEYANQNEKTVVFTKKKTYKKALRKIEIPAILVNSLDQDLCHLSLCLLMRQELKKESINAGIFTMSSNYAFMDGVYCFDYLREQSENQLSEKLNQVMLETIEEHDLDCIIFDAQEGLYNPFAPNDKQGVHVLERLEDFLVFDYAISIMPLNLEKEKYIEEYKRIIRDKLDVEFDRIIIDNVYWDVPAYGHKYCSIVSEAKKKRIYGTEDMEGSLTDIAQFICKDIYEKLEPKEDVKII